MTAYVRSQQSCKTSGHRFAGKTDCPTQVGESSQGTHTSPHLFIINLAWRFCFISSTLFIASTEMKQKLVYMCLHTNSWKHFIFCRVTHYQHSTITVHQRQPFYHTEAAPPSKTGQGTFCVPATPNRSLELVYTATFAPTRISYN